MYIYELQCTILGHMEYDQYPHNMHKGAYMNMQVFTSLHLAGKKRTVQLQLLNKT